MKKLLHIDSSILAANSVTRLLSADLVTAQRRLHPELEVTYRDVTTSPLPHFTGSHQGEEATLEEFLAADIIVIGAPMYNFGIPSQLKSWIDRLVVVGKTFNYGANGAEGLVKGEKKILIASARGGAYADTAHSFLDHQESYLTSVFGFLGVTDVTFFRAENVSRTELRDASIAAVQATINALAA